ncbi:PfkB family carbohydrate kinase [Liquorilactobacillus mali]|uniref:Ribokinase-like domain-containing protein n=1 Tax=Liquorilactobacillus mali TaxID=1618 RepID=A0A0R2FYR1_9LACO|nr:PfkB family carbohydrate kinase [Liquorilactobacillus mali]KRN33054.1 ribokinase-like domain-containing protein [Liquorilactobacillus mali]MDN7146262.1 PfkB family carbohydrate kinase [Liquorilactobacillus mali]
MNVLGLGDAVVDKYINKHIMYPGGNALNFAAFAKKLGQQASFLGVFGSDKEGSYLKEVIDSLKIDRSHSRTRNGENGYSEVKVLDSDRVFVGSNKGGISSGKLLKLNKEDYDYLRDFDLIHIGLYGQVDHLLDKLQAMNVLLSYDFSDNFTTEKVDGIISKINYGFFSLSGKDSNYVKSFLKRNYTSNNKVLLATRGSKSAIAFDGKNFFEKKPNNIVPVDTMAAGDAFITSFLLAYLSSGKDSVEEAMAKANIFAAKSCQVAGSFGFGAKY